MIFLKIWRDRTGLLFFFGSSCGRFFARNFARNPEISREILKNHENGVSTLIPGLLYGLEVLWDHPDHISGCLVALLGFLELFFGPK